ncbi:hypothetical protein WISP_91569 [Willisornis vidua]|uniref:Uncharacterized protein n=1 Tax=Willisornis vidua TaxID=1566151 RepID=A0ABQ9D5Z4_9PASS|nr:hypothetical protein WISP_91569 [Willisornis vidua]
MGNFKNAHVSFGVMKGTEHAPDHSKNQKKARPSHFSFDIAKGDRMTITSFPEAQQVSKNALNQNQCPCQNKDDDVPADPSTGKRFCDHYNQGIIIIMARLPEGRFEKGSTHVGVPFESVQWILK